MGRNIAIFLAFFVLILFLIDHGPEVDFDTKMPAEVMQHYFEGMQTTPEGINYRVVRKGTGRRPQITDKVKVHYRGFFKDGRVFDSSYKVKNPAIFQVNAVIEGWTKILLMMNEGDFYEVLIPSELAYGSLGAGNLIPPDTDLCFQIEFLQIY